MYLTNKSIYILMKVSKLVRWLSYLINLSRRLVRVGYLTARENEVELLTTKFYDMAMEKNSGIYSTTRRVDTIISCFPR